jgi:hypothetical protein
MVRGKKGAVVLSGLALALLMGPAAFAAPEDEKQQAQESQASSDNKSYLPPWMQNPATPAGVTAGAANKSAEAAALEDPAAKQKPPGQRTQRRHRDGFWPGLGFLWR